MRFLAHPLKLCKNGAEIYYKEECAIFLIKDSKGNGYKTVETDKDGIINFVLP